MQPLTSYRLPHRLTQELKSGTIALRITSAYGLQRATTCISSRVDVTGSGGILCSCKFDRIDDVEPTSDRDHYGLATTVEENMQRFTKREVSQALKALELLGRMGFPSVARAIQMVETGRKFDVTARDLRIADSIFGSDTKSLKGKTRRRASPIADITVGPAIVQQQQVLAIDVMFIEKIPI
jgi:hypothetical protein